MLGLEIIEVGIGLVFMYLTISLICSGIIEAFQKITKFRARHLKQAMGELLADPNFNGFAQKLYDHHLIKTPFQDKIGGVTWIDSKKFAKAILDIAQEGKSSSEYQALETAIHGISDDLPIKGRLVKLLEASGKKVETLEKQVESWFDESMEEVGRWYLKRIRTFVSIVGIIVATALNADTISVAKALWTDNELREATVSAATTYAQGLEERMKAAPADSAALQFGKTIHQIESDINETKILPIGWSKSALPYGKKGQDPILFWLLKIAGLLMTMGAVSLGAPYWYAQMKSLLNLRFQMTGGKQDTPPPPPASTTAPPPPAETARTAESASSTNNNTGDKPVNGGGSVG